VCSLCTVLTSITQPAVVQFALGGCSSQRDDYPADVHHAQPALQSCRPVAYILLLTQAT